jgi:hypothetical protein
MGVKCIVYYLVFSTNNEVKFLLLWDSLLFVHHRPHDQRSHGSSPEAIVEFLFDDRLKVSSSASEIFDLVRIFFPFEIFSMGCAISSSSGSSPRSYDGVLAADHRPKEVWTFHLLSVFFSEILLDLLIWSPVWANFLYVCLDIGPVSLMMLAQSPSCLIIKRGYFYFITLVLNC